MMQVGLPPLLSGDCSRAARAVLGEISSALIAVSPSMIGEHSLAFGLAGLAVTHAHLAAYFPERDHRACARRALELAATHLTEEASSPSLFSGFTGVAWAFAHLDSLELEPGQTGADDPLSELDDVLLAALAQSRWDGEHDLLDGLVGLAIYWLERLPRAMAVVGLQHVVRHLDQLAHHEGDAVAWADHEGSGGFDAGVAHGTPGMIPVLAAIIKLAVPAPAALRLLKGAVRWVELQRRADDEAQFPFSVGGNERPARSGWCHGAPGVAAALLCAALAVGEPRWRALALDIARRAALRPLAGSGVVDACLCHGGVGLGHLYHRIYAQTGEHFAAEAARHWFAEALASRTPGQGFAGFISVRHGDHGAVSYAADPGVLMGASGVALGLAAALGGPEPSWDRAFAISTR